MRTTIYKVESIQPTGPYTHVAYATGERKDIEEFYQHRAGYGLEITPIKIVDILPESAKKIKTLRQAKVKAEFELAAINKQLKELQ